MSDNYCAHYIVFNASNNQHPFCKHSFEWSTVLSLVSLTKLPVSRSIKKVHAYTIASSIKSNIESLKETCFSYTLPLIGWVVDALGSSPFRPSQPVLTRTSNTCPGRHAPLTTLQAGQQASWAQLEEAARGS